VLGFAPATRWRHALRKSGVHGYRVSCRMYTNTHTGSTNARRSPRTEARVNDTPTLTQRLLSPQLEKQDRVGQQRKRERESDREREKGDRSSQMKSAPPYRDASEKERAKQQKTERKRSDCLAVGPALPGANGEADEEVTLINNNNHNNNNNNRTREQQQQ